MALTSSERFRDEVGGVWEIKHVLASGGRRLILVDPDGFGRELTPVDPQPSQPSRPSVDAETPLPLENL